MENEKKDKKNETEEVTTLKIKSWQDYVTTIMPFMVRASAGMHRFGLEYPPYLFRGQPSTEYILIASIFREFLVEDRNKGKIPEIPKTFFKAERNVIGKVRNALSDFVKYSEWDLVAVAQHYGIPTRYLDWTSDPFVALAFAVKEEEQKTSPVVWVLKTNMDDFCIPEEEDSPIPNAGGATTKIYLPNKVVSQVFAQDSYLMRQVVEKEGNQYTVVPVEENDTFKERLWKIEIESKALDDIRKSLSAFKLDVTDLLRPENRILGG